jgi:hypothetical protein
MKIIKPYTITKVDTPTFKRGDKTYYTHNEFGELKETIEQFWKRKNIEKGGGINFYVYTVEPLYKQPYNSEEEREHDRLLVRYTIK